MSDWKETLLRVALYFPAAFWEAYVLSILWLWFLVPLGLPVIGWAVFAGVSLGFSLIRFKTPLEDAKYPELYAVITARTFMPLIALFLGWLLSIFVEVQS